MSGDYYEVDGSGVEVVASLADGSEAVEVDAVDRDGNVAVYQEYEGN